MAASYRESTGESAALALLFQEDPRLPGRLQALDRAAGQRPARIQDQELAKKLFGEHMFLSPTQIETYHSCRFKYFCRYGLNAKERRPAEVDVMQYGTLMHYLFEQVFRAPAEERAAWGGGGAGSQGAAAHRPVCRGEPGGMELLSAQERYRLERMARSACKLIRHVEEELAQSRFTPDRFELGLGEDREYPPLRVETRTAAPSPWGAPSTGWTYTAAPGGKEYVRVIDYKTGAKVFRLADVLYA